MENITDVTVLAQLYVIFKDLCVRDSVERQ